MGLGLGASPASVVVVGFSQAVCRPANDGSTKVFGAEDFWYDSLQQSSCVTIFNFFREIENANNVRPASIFFRLSSLSLRDWTSFSSLANGGVFYVVLTC